MYMGVHVCLYMCMCIIFVCEMVPLKCRYLDSDAWASLLIFLSVTVWSSSIPTKIYSPFPGASGSVLECPSFIHTFIHSFNIYFVPTMCQASEIQR